MARLIDKLREQHARLFEPMPVEVPEWETTLYIRPLRVSEALRFINADETDQLASMLSASLCDANGEPVFTEDEIRSLPASMMPVLNRLADECARRFGMEEAGKK